MRGEAFAALALAAPDHLKRGTFLVAARRPVEHRLRPRLGLRRGTARGTEMSRRGARHHAAPQNSAIRSGGHAECIPRVRRAQNIPISRHFSCRRRDSNPRHADYDSAALWLYSAVCAGWGTRKGTQPRRRVPNRYRRQALNLARQSVDPSRSCRSVQIVWSRGRYGRIRRSGCCHGCCHEPARQQSATLVARSPLVGLHAPNERRELLPDRWPTAAWLSRRCSPCSARRRPDRVRSVWSPSRGIAGR
jgi:hypothetical protein